MTTKLKNIVLTCLMALMIFGFAFWAWLKPADSYSETERKDLAQFPKITWDSIVKKSFMKDFETYTLDQFPLRDSFAKLKGGFNLWVLNMKNNLRGDNNYYVEDGYLSEIEYPMDEGDLTHATAVFQKIYNLYLKSRGITPNFSIIPDKNYFMAENAGQLVMDYDKLVELMKNETSYMEYIDIFPYLSLEDYYKTDTHWRQEKIVDVAQHLAASMGVTLAGQYKENVLDKPFSGVYYGQAGIPFVNKEELVYLTNEILDACIVRTYDPITGKKVEMPMYDVNNEARDRDLYEIFLSGSLGYIEIENPNATTDKELVIFRDSFGSSLSPLFAEGYAKVTIIDIRQMASTELIKYMRFTDQDVLFIFSTLVLNNSSTLK